MGFRSENLPELDHKGPVQGSRISAKNWTKLDCSITTYNLFLSYLHFHDMCLRSQPELWLHANGTIPACHWFITCLCQFFPKSIAGRSIHDGGDTALAVAGTTPLLIYAAGQWSTDTFNHYICKTPFLLIARLTGQAPCTVADFI